MKRIGVLTFHHVINEGAILQALSLTEQIRRMRSTDEVHLIDYRSRIADLRDLRYIFSRPFPSALPCRLSSHLKLTNFINKHLPLGPERLKTDDPKDAQALLERYDAIFVGSDEVWKIEAGRFSRPFPNVYWLPYSSRTLKFSYAPSAKRPSAQGLPAETLQRMGRLLAAFDGISTRDEHTTEIVRTVAPEMSVTRVADPTIFLDGDRGVDVAPKLKAAGLDLDRPILALIMAPDALSRAVAAHFRSLGWQIAGFCVYNGDVDVNLAGKLDPLEWVASYRHVRGVVTNRFHPTIFSIRAGVPFVSLDRSEKDRPNKIKGLLRDYGAEDRRVVQSEALADIPAFLSLCERQLASMNAEPLRIAWGNWRETSKAFLAACLAKLDQDR